MPSNASLEEKQPVQRTQKKNKPGLNAPGKTTLSSLQVQLVVKIEENPSISYDPMAAKLGKNQTTMTRNIQKLINIGALKQIGS